METRLTRSPLLLGLFRIGQGLPSPLDWTPEEDVRWGHMRAPQRAAQYRAGRWLLRRLCALSTGLAMEEIRLNAEGAPLASGPAGSDLPRLSLSHSGDWVAATAYAGPCGVDLERRGTRRDWRALARHLNVPGPGGEEAVLRAWTLDEARFKAGEARGLVVRRFESPDYLGCLLAPLDAAPEWHCFGGAVPVELTF
jgi:hypothetical protein